MARPRTRLSLKLAACIAAGAAVTTLVAWAAVLRMRQSIDMSFNAISTPGYWGPRVMAHTQLAALRKGAPAVSTAWVFADSVQPSALQVRTNYCYGDAGGWPLLALAREYTVYGSGLAPDAGAHAKHAERGWTIYRFGPERWWLPITLPLIVIWPGFAVNTALYATLIFTLWTAPGIGRHRLRKSRNHCPACGYDRRGLTGKRCPECGSPWS